MKKVVITGAAGFIGSNLVDDLLARGLNVLGLDNFSSGNVKFIESAKKKVLAGEVSPILYFMELKLMDFKILSGYTRFWKWTIKYHLKPNVFRKLSESKLQRYADAFEISVDELKNFKGN